MGVIKNRKFGDRKDARLVRDLDGMHALMPYMYLNRTDNEAFIMETVDTAPIDRYLEKKNNELKEKVERGELPKEALDDPYKMFYVILAAIVKTVVLRPKLNRFIADKRTYQRDDVSLAFVVKKKFADNGKEALAFKEFSKDATMDSVYETIVKEINFCKDENQVDNSTDFLDKFAKLPRWLLKIIFVFFRKFCEKGWMPRTLIETDPGQASVFLTNLGSIHLKSGYHHLSNWGTNSFFVILGEKKIQCTYDKEGNKTLREVLPIGLTIDERIADGYYYAKSIRLFKKLLENPELLEDRADKEIDY